MSNQDRPRLGVASRILGQENDPRDWRKVRVEYGVSYHLSDVRAFARYHELGNAPWKQVREFLRGELANVGQMGVTEQIAEGRVQLQADEASQ